MQLDHCDEIRDKTKRRRRAPREPIQIVASFDGEGIFPDEAASRPLELTLEPTNAAGEPAPWLDGAWWADVIQRWAEGTVTVRVAPTPGALLHSIVLYQLEMLRRVTPSWHIIGYAYVDEVAAENNVTALAASPYHEIRFIDAPRPGPGPPLRGGSPHGIGALFGRIRQEQARLGVTTPILVRLPSYQSGAGLPTGRPSNTTASA